MSRLCQLCASSIWTLVKGWVCFTYSNTIKILFQTYAKYMSTLSEGYAYHMFSLFLGYLNSKQTLFKSYLINCSILLCKVYFSPMWRLCIFYDFSLRLTTRSKISFQKLSKLYVWVMWKLCHFFLYSSF